MTITNATEHHFSIGELSRRTGVNIETIRYYEKVGVLPAPRRNSGGRRVYDQDKKRVLAFVKRGRELGFSLTAIRSLLGLGVPETPTCRDVKAIASAHVEDVRTKIADLVRLERILSDTIERCTGEVAPVCPILDLLDDPAGAKQRQATYSNPD